MKRICVLGSNSGRNAGDAAILSSIIQNLSRIRPGIVFEVPTTNKEYLYKKFGRDKVRGVSMMPWTGSIRFAGLPTILSICRSDVSIITDGIIFDIKLFNPLFNFLILLVFLMPFARLFRKKVVCFLVGVGPLDSLWGRRFARFVCNRCDSIMVREPQSEKLLKSIGIQACQITVYADAAFITVPARKERAREILMDVGADITKTIVAINVNSYVDRWLPSDLRVSDPLAFKKSMARAIDQIIETVDCQVVMIGTQVMDAVWMKELVSLTNQNKSIMIISNSDYSAEEIMGVLGEVNVFVGMRLHSIILASAMSTPCIGLVYAPKVRDHMTLLGLDDYVLELKDFTENSLVEKVRISLEKEDALRSKLDEKVGALKAKTFEGYKLFAENYL